MVMQNHSYPFILYSILDMHKLSRYDDV